MSLCRRFFAMLLPAVVEHVIVVPKFFQDVTPQRLRPPEPQQLVEQLVEVPTTVSYSSLLRTVEQLVDLPVPGGGGPSSGPHGFLPRQRSTASPSRTRISKRIVEQIVDPVSRGSLPVSLPGQSSSSSHSPAGDEERADEPGKGVFRTFPHGKKCGVPGRSVRTCPGTSAHGHRQLMTCLWARMRRFDVLLAVPMELRSPAQRARLYELISASSQARRRKRKKRRKKKAPKSSSFRSSSGVWPRRCGQGSRSRSSSSCGCGRLCEHVRHVPAVADLQWKVPPSISSTKWWTFQLCYGDRCSSWTKLFSCPVLCNDWPLGTHSADICAGSAVAVHRWSSTSLFLRSCCSYGPACSENHRDSAVAVGQVVDAPAEQVVPCPLLSTTGASGQTVQKTAVSPQLQFVNEIVDISVVVQRQFPMVLFRTIELLQLQYTDKVLDVPVVPVQFPSAGVEFSGRWLPECFRLSSVRQWVHIRRQSSGAFVRISYFLREGLSRGRFSSRRGSHWKSGHYFNKQLL